METISFFSYFHGEVSCENVFHDVWLWVESTFEMNINQILFWFSFWGLGKNKQSESKVEDEL